MNKRHIRLISILLSSLLFCATLGAVGARAATPEYNISHSPKVGIDVSEHQGVIYWSRVKGQIDFAFIRIGCTYYGSLVFHKDDYFDANVRGATQAGIPIGVYYYGCAVSEEMAEREANFVLDLLAEYPATFSYPIAYDIEVDNDKNSKVPPVATKVSKKFCEVISNAGYYPMVYSYTSYFNPYITTAEISENDFWQAHYYTSYAGLTPRQLASKAGARPSILGNYDSNISIWQCTDAASVSGISGGVDGNISCIDYDALIRTEGYNGYPRGSGDTRAAICTSGTDVRRGPSNAFSVIGQSAEGQRFTLVRYANKGWLEIMYNGQVGYVNAGCFSIEDQASDGTRYQVVKYAVCTAGNLNLRSAPSTDSAVVGQVILQDELLLIEDMGYWLKVEYKGEIAYMYSSFAEIKTVYVEITEPDDNPPDDGESNGNENGGENSGTDTPDDGENTKNGVDGGENPGTSTPDTDNSPEGDNGNGTDGTPNDRENPVKGQGFFAKIGKAIADFFRAVGQFFKSLFT